MVAKIVREYLFLAAAAVAGGARAQRHPHKVGLVRPAFCVSWLLDDAPPFGTRSPGGTRRASSGSLRPPNRRLRARDKPKLWSDQIRSAICQCGLRRQAIILETAVEVLRGGGR